jgi:hypothetical protein
MAGELSGRNPFRQQAEGFHADVLVVDEASTMLFPPFLSLAVVAHALIQLSQLSGVLSPIKFDSVDPHVVVSAPYAPRT